jgi:hypothetical protein
MIELKDIITHFKPKQLQLIQKFYKNSDKQSQKKLLLLQLIINKKHVDSEDASEILYHRKPDSAISQLKKRLKEDLIYFLTLFSRDMYEDDPELKCRNLILQSDVLLYKGLPMQSNDALLKAKKIAEKYELYVQDIAIREKILQRSIIGQETAVFQEAFEKSLLDLQNYFGSKQFAKNDFVIESQKELDEFNQKYFQLQKLLVVNGQSKIKIWFLLASLQYYRQYNDFSRLEDIIKELSPMLDNNNLTGIDTASALHKCALTCLFIRRYDDALQFTVKCIKILEQIRAYDLRAYETLFLAHYRKQNYNEAREVVAQVNRIDGVAHDKNFSSKWDYFMAGLEFNKGHFRESLNWLNKSNNHAGVDYALNQRILELLNIIELNELSWMGYKLENLRKQLFRFKNKNIERFRLIYLLLKNLWDNNLNFSLTCALSQDKILKLKENPNIALSYELVNVEDWITSKK